MRLDISREKGYLSMKGDQEGNSDNIEYSGTEMRYRSHSNFERILFHSCTLDKLM